METTQTTVSKAKARKLVFMTRLSKGQWAVHQWDPSVKMWRQSDCMTYAAAQHLVMRRRAEMSV